jgi:hypothetical protein
MMLVAGGVAVQCQDAWVGELECSCIMSRRCDADVVSARVVAAVIQYSMYDAPVSC